MDLSFSESTKATYRIVVHVHGKEREGRSVQAHHATAGLHSVTATIPSKLTQTEGELRGKLVVGIEVKDADFVFGFAGKVVVVTSEKSIYIDPWGELTLHAYTQAADRDIGNTAYPRSIDHGVGVGIYVSCPKGSRYTRLDVSFSVFAKIFS